jgi:hypothetical protein
VGRNSISLVFARLGKRMENEFCVKFYDRLRDECLNAHEFKSIKKEVSRLLNLRDLKVIKESLLAL